jgi:hypothetical protein
MMAVPARVGAAILFCVSLNIESTELLYVTLGIARLHN